MNDKEEKRNHIEYMIKTIRLGLILGGFAIIGLFISHAYAPTEYRYVLIPVTLLVMCVMPLWRMLFLRYKNYVEDLEDL